MTKPTGWKQEPARHSLAAKGVRTRRLKELKPQYRTVSVRVLGTPKDFYALGYNNPESNLDTGVVADWITEGLRHDPTPEDYQNFGDMVAEEVITGRSDSELESQLRYYEGTAQYHEMRKAWARGYAQSVREIVEESRKKYVNFPWDLTHKGGK